MKRLSSLHRARENLKFLIYNQLQSIYLVTKLKLKEAWVLVWLLLMNNLKVITILP